MTGMMPKFTRPAKKPSAGKQPESAAITHLKELAQGHGARLAVAVDDEPADGDQHVHRNGHLAPPLQREARDHEQLERRHVADRAGALLRPGGGEQKPAGVAPAGHEVRHAFHVTPRMPDNNATDQNRQRQNQPVDQMHHLSDFRCAPLNAKARRPIDLLMALGTLAFR